VCDTCCHSWLKPIDICDGCVQDECASGRGPPDCCVSFECVDGQCQRAYRATGTYPNMSACMMACEAPSVCTGSSVNLTSGNCIAWQRFSLNPLHREWAEGKCGAKVHTDPCSCTFGPYPAGYDKVGCTNGRITRLFMYGPDRAYRGQAGCQWRC
jgi:hypothetical protein